MVGGPAKWRLGSALAFVAIVSLLWPTSRTSADPLLEKAVKATYLYKLGPFVDWPAGVLGAPQSPFTICVIGKDPFGSLLDSAVSGQHVGDHPVVVRRLAVAVAVPAPSCAITFLAGSTKQSVGDGLRVLGNAPTLTVTDGATPAGIVDFVIDQGRVKFRFDIGAASEHGLVVRSQLLDLAVSVSGRRP